MFSAEQYRAKAAEYAALLAGMPRSPNETSEFRNLEQTYTTLAENEEWMAINIDKTVRRRRNRDGRIDLDEDEERILRCVTTAAIMQSSTVPAELRQGVAGAATLSISSQTPASPGIVVE
jgi:hypothetical protein